MEEGQEEVEEEERKREGKLNDEDEDPVVEKGVV